jgi:AcrR family transcriptional regulator
MMQKYVFNRGKLAPVRFTQPGYQCNIGCHAEAEGWPVPDPLTDNQVALFREQICDIAARQFAEKGIENVSMRSLAREVGYSATALYSYFRNKDEILAALRARALNQLTDHLETALKNCPESRLQTRALADAYLEFAEAHPETFKLTFDLNQPIVILYPELEAAQQRCKNIFRLHISTMLAGGHLKGDANILAHLLWSSLHGLISLNLSGKFDFSPPFELLYQQMVELFTRGATPGEIINGIPASGEQYSFDL